MTQSMTRWLLRQRARQFEWPVAYNCGELTLVFCRTYQKANTALEILAGPRSNPVPRRPGAAYGVPTNVVTLCAVSVTVTREFDTVTGESWPRLLAADVSYGVSVHGTLPEM